MDSNLHINHLPGPRQSIVDKGSSPLTPPVHHLNTTQRQPRSAGFSYGCQLDQRETRETRRVSEYICEELVKGPATIAQDDKPRHFIQTMLTSISKHRSMKENNKMLFARRRTSEGRKYNQIVCERICNDNASAYQVNECRQPLTPTGKGRRRQVNTSSDLASDVIAGTTEEPVHGCLAHSSLEDGEASHRHLPYQTLGCASPTSSNLGNKHLKRRGLAGNTTAPWDGAILESSQRKSTSDDPLGLLRDLSHIMSQGETSPPATNVSQVEDQPRIHDFATIGSALAPRAHVAARRRLRSPAKAIGKQTVGEVTKDKSLNTATRGGQSRLGRNSDCIILPTMAFKGPTTSPLVSPLPIAEEHILGTTVIHCQSKEASTVSTGSNAEDNQSDASSGVVSNAQSAVFVKIPPQPGPAPPMPLPSLPEGLDNFAPATPKASPSSRNSASPGSWRTKLSPQNSPARYQYRLYPPMNGSPSKMLSSPSGVDADINSTQVTMQPSSPLRWNRGGSSFPRSEILPASMSVGRIGELERRKKEKAGNTRRETPLDLARMSSHQAIIAKRESLLRNGVNRESYREEMPNSIDSHNTALYPIERAPETSHTSSVGVATTLPYRNSSAFSPKLSPIIVVAEQEPTSPVQQAPSQKSLFSKKKAPGQPQGLKANGFHPVPFHLASPILQQSVYENGARPISSHSLPNPHLVARLSSLLKRPSDRSSHHSSIHENDRIEARLSAMERKNALLERAFLAVLETSATLAGGLEEDGREDVGGNTLAGMSGRM